MCDLAEADLYPNAQRMVTAVTLVAWLDDSLLTSQQRIWILQGLRDNSGRDLGTDSATWQRWYESR